MRRCLRDARGSFTLEASLVLPVIFYAILVLLFFCLYLYQNALLGQAASAAAERSAYTWDNSYRNDLTGAFEEGHYDSLYWRLKDDGMLQSIFGWGEANGAVRLRLPAGADSADSLAGKKLARTGSGLPGNISGEMEYDNRMLLRKVKVAMERFVPLPPLESWLGDISQTGSSYAYVIEPMEFIRTVELAHYYGAKFKGKGGDTMDRTEAGNALKLFGK